MLNSAKEIWEDVEGTVDQLLANAAAMKQALASDHLADELEALQRAQESLMARLVHRHTLLQVEKKKRISEEIRTEAIQKKIADYGKAHARLIDQVSKKFCRKSKIRKGSNRSL